MSLTIERLKEVLKYDPNTGQFTRYYHSKVCLIGRPAGTVSVYGYAQISIDGTMYRANRLAWLYIHGDDDQKCHWCPAVVPWPKLHVDHLNDIRLDNRLTNLVPSCMRCNVNRNRWGLKPHTIRRRIAA